MIGVLTLATLDWAIFQFGFLPKMTEQERREIYPAWMSSPYPYAISLAFVCASAWFIFSYRGRYSTHGRRIVVFGMALGTLAGLLIRLAIRVTWHI